MKLSASRRNQRPVDFSISQNLLARKLSLFSPLSKSDRQVLDVLALGDERFPADVDIITEGESPRSVFWIKGGLAVRYRGLPRGGRQIMTFLIPGDLCDEHAFVVKAMDHSIGTITPVCIAPISRESMMELFSHRPRISAALWWSSLQEKAILRERIVSLGRRDARGRLAYLLCELFWRHEAVELTNGESFHLPLTQTELGDTLGLTPVHINHVLKEFRSQALIAMRHKVLYLLDVPALQQIAGLSKDYLQLSGASDELAGYFDSLEVEEQKLR
jgi:CRP-like cAMP-binding protein